MNTSTENVEQPDGRHSLDAVVSSRPSNDHYGVPGVGGSLGICSLCGENFLASIILGSGVKTFSVSGCTSTLYAHEKCAAKYEGQGKLDVLQLPSKSPLREAYERANEKLNHGESLRAGNERKN